MTSGPPPPAVVSVRGLFSGGSTMQDTTIHEQRFEKRLRSPGADIEVKEPDDGGPRIRIPVSSTAEDRDGDQFSREGLENQRDQLESGTVPMMLDHGRGSGGGWYGTLGMIGRWDGGEIVTEDGEDVLYGEGTLNSANEDAETLAAYLDNDMPVGASVGFRALEYDRDREADSITFNAVDLLEVSLVGIPSNPMTVNETDAAGALAKAYSDGGLDGDVFARALAALADDDAVDEQLLDALTDADSADDPPGGDMTDDKDTNSDTDDDLLERILSLQERTLDRVDDQDERLDALEGRIEERADGDGEDDDDDEEEDEDDDKGTDPDGRDDEKSVTLVAGADADEDVVKAIDQLREKADNGALELENLDGSKTMLFGDDEDGESDEKDAADSGITDNGGWI